MSITPERIAEIRLALQDLGRGIYRYNLDLRGNGVASLVTELLDDAQRALVHEQRLDALRQRLPDLGAQLDSQGPWEAALFSVAQQLAAVPEMSDESRRADVWKNEDRKARTYLASLLDLPMPPGAEPPGWTTIFDTVSATVFQLGEARKEIDALTPRWQEGEPPADALVWREGVDHPIRVGSDDMILRFPGCCYWFAGPLWAWGTARWAPIPKPTEG